MRPTWFNLLTWRLFQFASEEEKNTVQMLPELRDAVSCLWTAVNSEEWKWFLLYWVKRTCSVELPMIVPRANCTSHSPSPRNQHCFLSHSTFRFKKKEKKKERQFLFVMNRGRVLRGNVHKELTSWADNVTVSQGTFCLSHWVPMWNVCSLGYPSGDDRLMATLWVSAKPTGRWSWVAMYNKMTQDSGLKSRLLGQE